MLSKFDHRDDSFVCFNYPGGYKRGIIVSTLPQSLCKNLVHCSHIFLILAYMFSLTLDLFNLSVSTIGNTC